MPIDKREVLIIGGIGAAAVVAIAIGGRSSGSGVTFSAPNPTSVAAVENSAAAEIASHNSAVTQQQQNVLGAVVQLAGIQNSLALGRLAASQQEYTTEVSGQVSETIAGLQSATSEANTSTNAAAAVANAKTSANAAEYAAQLYAQTQQSVSANAAQAQEQVAAQASAAAQAQAHASQQNGLWGAISGILGGVAKAVIPGLGAASAVTGTGSVATGAADLANAGGGSWAL